MSPLVLSDKNSRNDGLYQGTPSGVPQRSAPMIAKAFRPRGLGVAAAKADGGRRQWRHD